jgi:CheY-like chemotaxis protein
MEAVGRLAGGIAHDFNNVLTAILGYSDLLLGQIEERHWMWKHLNEIRKASDFASSLTQQLLAFSRRQPLYPRVFAVNESVRKVEKMLQRVIGEQIKVRTQLYAELGCVKADATQFEQVLLNLAVNARDAMPDGGTLVIATSDVSYVIEGESAVPDMPAGEYVKLMVTDSGVGIPADVIKHIFEPFFTTKENGQGTGLGLSTCYGIVRQSGGYIAVESSSGLGTSFSIYLPRVDEKGEPAQAIKQVGALPGGHETILYVEDEITVRNLTAHVLRRLGYTVLEAGDGAQARGLCESHDVRKIDLLLSDVVLPDLGGKELCDWLRDRTSDIRVLFCSGYVDENILKRYGIDLGTAFLQKPFSPSDLARKVREVIDSTN